jgi:hypothetical protein
MTTYFLAPAPPIGGDLSDVTTTMDLMTVCPFLPLAIILLTLGHSRLTLSQRGRGFSHFHLLFNPFIVLKGTV